MEHNRTLRVRCVGARRRRGRRRDKTHFFISYEGQRRRDAVTRTYSFPTPLEVRGDFSQSTGAILDPLPAGHSPVTWFPPRGSTRWGANWRFCTPRRMCPGRDRAPTTTAPTQSTPFAPIAAGQARPLLQPEVHPHGGLTGAVIDFCINNAIIGAGRAQPCPGRSAHLDRGVRVLGAENQAKGFVNT
jgi:hypothetical protein